MKIGIVVHSKTGNTYSVAERLSNALLQVEHEVALEKVMTKDDKQKDPRKIEIKDKPKISDYDALIFGAPVWAFSLSTVMTAYLKQVGSMQGKKVICYVTHAFPYPWLGGSRAVGQMIKLCQEMGADVIETGIINWSNKQREAEITGLVERASELF